METEGEGPTLSLFLSACTYTEIFIPGFLNHFGARRTHRTCHETFRCSIRVTGRNKKQRAEDSAAVPFNNYMNVSFILRDKVKQMDDLPGWQCLGSDGMTNA